MISYLCGFVVTSLFEYVQLIVATSTKLVERYTPGCTSKFHLHQTPIHKPDTTLDRNSLHVLHGKFCNNNSTLRLKLNYQ